MVVLLADLELARLTAGLSHGSTAHQPPADALFTYMGGSLTKEHDALAVTTRTMSVVAVELVPGGVGLPCSWLGQW